MGIKSRKKLVIFFFLLPAVICFLLFQILPLIASFFISFTNWDVIGGSPEFIGLENYIKIFTTSEFYTTLLHGLYFAVLYIPSIVILSLLLAMLLNRKLPKMSIFRVLCYIPVLTSWVAAALIWKSALSQFGFVNQFLSFAGITGPSWLQDPTWAMPGIVIASVWKDVGYISLLFIGGLNSINPEYYEAASVDGANSFVKFFKITLPMLSPTLFFVLVTSIMSALQLFTQVMVMTNGGPHGATQVLVERIYSYAFEYYKMGYASSLAWVLLLFIFIITLLQFKMQKKWVNYDA